MAEGAARARWRFPWLLGGTLVSWAAMVTYFVVVPWWPDLRDSGTPSVVLAAFGVLAVIVGFFRSLVARRYRIVRWALLVLALLPAAFLPYYIHVLSYDLPRSDGVLAIGAAAPDFRLMDASGREVRLSDVRARWRVLIFFRGHW